MWPTQKRYANRVLNQTIGDRDGTITPADLMKSFRYLVLGMLSGFILSLFVVFLAVVQDELRAWVIPLVVVVMIAIEVPKMRAAYRRAKNDLNALPPGDL